MISWLSSHWELVALVLGVAINIINAATSHWSEHTGVVKWLLFVADCLSIIRSKGTTGSTLGNAKLPIVPTGATGIVDGKKIVGLALPLLFLIGAASGCCTSARCFLARGLAALQAADKIAIPAMEKICVEKVTACGKVTPDKCPAFATCNTALLGYQAAADGIGRGLGACNKSLATLGVR